MSNYNFTSWMGKNDETSRVAHEDIFDKFTASQKKAWDIIENNDRIFLTGEAGCGKSWLIKQYINKHPNCIVTAPTGIAAININGSTIHRTFHAPVSVIGPTEFQKKPSKALRAASTLIIDEISMCRRDLFDYIMRTIEKNHLHLKVIVLGDLFQLPSVVTDRDRDALTELYPDGVECYHSHYWKDFTEAVLLENCRQEDEYFLQSLNLVRVGDRSGIPLLNSRVRERGKKDICLCATNSMVNKINNEELEKLRAPMHTFETEISGNVNNGDLCVPKILNVKEGCRVMTISNDKNDNYVNGSLGYISNIGSFSIDVTLDSGKKVTLTKETFEVLSYTTEGNIVKKEVIGTYTQFPIKVAYAITIHKSQGQTYDFAHIYPYCFETGQLYVALSRVRTLEGLSLEYPISSSCILR